MHVSHCGRVLVRVLLSAVATALISACGPGDRQQAGPAPAKPVVTDRERAVSAVKDLADEYYEFLLARSPEIAYLSGVEPDRHDGLYDNTPAALTKAEIEQDRLYAEISAVNADDLAGTPSWITHAYLLQQLRSDIALRTCRRELWNVSHMGGWHTRYTLIAQYQPVGTPEARSEALARWSKFPEFIQQEIANLRRGLASRYSAPRPVVRRVIEQLDGLLAMGAGDSPYSSPARRDDDEPFKQEFTRLVEGEILPRLREYRDYLAEEYLSRAREALPITEIPGGHACYEASLQSYTTLERSPEQVFELGKQTVAKNRKRVEELGEAAFGLTDFEAIMERVKTDPDDHFDSRKEMLEFARATVARAAAETPGWVGRMPSAEVRVVPYPEYEEATGVSARYEPGDEGRSGIYRISLHQAEEQTRSATEAVAFHETWPGHHLQVAIAQEIDGLHPVTRLIWFSGPGEGWARYAETLAYEMGLYQTVNGPIRRLAWPARGMVVDPGIHLMGWTRQEAIAFMDEAGRMTETELNDMVDRIAVLPGQLTAYDSGGLEIFALRALARERLGEDFDIREFHDRVLENGTVPLDALRAHIESWLEEKTPR